MGTAANGDPLSGVEPHAPPTWAEDRRRLAALANTGSPEALLIPPGMSASAPAGDHSPGQPTECETSDSPRFSEVVALYREQFAPSQLKASTQRGYDTVLDGLLVPELGERPIEAIDAKLVRALDIKLVRRGLQPSTRRNAQIVLRSVLCRFAVEAGLLEEPPRFPRLPRCGNKVADIPSSEEVEQLLAASSCHARLAFMLAAFAGLRAGEVRGLRWMDVDMERKHLVVRRSICHGVVGTPKSGHERVVPLVPRLHAALSQQHAARSARPGDAVSQSSRKRSWGQYALGKAFESARKRAELPRWRFHDLRHYFVTALFQAGVPAHVVQALAGHEHLVTTQRYTHVAAKELGAGIKRLAQHQESRR